MKKDSYRFWHHLKQLGVHGSCYTDTDTDIPADAINEHFINNQKSSNFDPHVIQNKIAEFYAVESDNKFTLDTSTEQEINDIICSISTTATGADGINSRIIKLCLPFAIPSITHIINYSITSCTFPDLWKMAVINPIWKTPGSKTVTNLRPISILP